MNKLLQRQLQKHSDMADKVPGNLSKLLDAISNSYDHYEKDRKLIERSIDISSKEMIELNSQLKKDKADLKAYKELKTLFEDINEVSFSIDIVGYRLLEISAVCEKVYGYTRKEFFSDNQTWRKVIHPEDKHIAKRQIETLRQGKQVLCECRIVHKDGSIRWVENKVIPVFDAGGQLLQINGVTSDVTSRKNAEFKIRRSEEQYRRIVETAQEGIWMIDEANKTNFVNKRLCEILGYTAGEMMGKEIFYFMDEEGKKIATAGMEKGKQGSNQNIDFKFITKEGKVAWTHLSNSPLLDDNGTYIGALAMVSDITQRKLDEALLQTSEINLAVKNKELERKNKELEQFAFVASHDLQEPLRTTSSFVSLLQRLYKGNLDEKANKYLAYISQATDRMQVLITDLLEYSRIGNLKETKDVDCNKILGEALADLNAAINESGAEITMGDLPAIKGFETEIKQLFGNLVSNSIKFRQTNNRPQIAIVAWLNKDHWQFAFSDNGIGIAKEHYERIFTIFQRLHTRNQYQGSGIGLSHCKKIVELHKGKIWLESEPGRGTTFYFTIPQNIS